MAPAATGWSYGRTHTEILSGTSQILEGKNVRTGTAQAASRSWIARLRAYFESDARHQIHWGY